MENLDIFLDDETTEIVKLPVIEEDIRIKLQLKGIIKANDDQTNAIIPSIVAKVIEFTKKNGMRHPNVSKKNLPRCYCTMWPPIFADLAMKMRRN